MISNLLETLVSSVAVAQQNMSYIVKARFFLTKLSVGCVLQKRYVVGNGDPASSQSELEPRFAISALKQAFERHSLSAFL